ncbi:MAG TPA: nickel-responsive transcriptional regulator NikR [Candidatus Nitrosopolaris sp.]|nr:nickel-responsive transcriptional regulator NikR [Candidatus Nitrosopolaris sp.]
MKRAIGHKHSGKSYVHRISVSLSPELLAEFDESMIKAGFTDRSKAIQTALHSFINEHNWKNSHYKSGAGAIIILYDNRAYNQNTHSTKVQHKFNDIISAATHLHLNDDNCLESIMIRGETKRMKELANELSNNRGIKSLKFHFVNLV